MRLMCGYLSILFFSAFLAMCLGRVLAAATRDGMQEKGATTETSRYVAEPLTFPLSVHDAGKSRVSVSRLLGIWPLQHACDPHLLHTDIHDSGAAVGPLVCCRLGPLRSCWGRTEPHLQHWGLPDVATSISWLQQHGNSGPQPRTLRCWAA